MDRNVLELFVKQKFDLYIYKDILDIIYNYADESLHKDYMDHLIAEIDYCIPTTLWYNPYAEYIYMTIGEKNYIQFPTNMTAPEYDNHNRIIARIKEKFKRIRYYKYRLNCKNNLCWKEYQDWKIDEL